MQPAGPLGEMKRDSAKLHPHNDLSAGGQGRIKIIQKCHQLDLDPFPKTPLKRPL